MIMNTDRPTVTHSFQTFTSGFLWLQRTLRHSEIPSQSCGIVGDNGNQRRFSFSKLLNILCCRNKRCLSCSLLFLWRIIVGICDRFWLWRHTICALKDRCWLLDVKATVSICGCPKTMNTFFCELLYFGWTTVFKAAGYLQLLFHGWRQQHALDLSLVAWLSYSCLHFFILV